MSPIASVSKRQARSIRTENALIGAAEMIFATAGFRASKISDITNSANVSTGSFYHHFKSKEDIACVMIDRYIDDAMIVISTWDLSRKTHGDVYGLMRYLATLFMNSINERLGIYRASLRLIAWGEESYPLTAALVEPIEQKAQSYLGEYLVDITAPEPALAMRHSIQLLIMVMLQTRLGAGALFPKNQEELITMCLSATMGILQPSEKP